MFPERYSFIGSLHLFIPVLMIAILVGGCHHRRTDWMGEEPCKDAQVLLGEVEKHRLNPESVIADARIRLSASGIRGSADHFIVFRRPYELRLETLSFFGNPVVLVSATKDWFIMWEIDAQRAWKGEATAESLSALLPVGLSPEEIGGLLSGVPPFSDGEMELLPDHRRRRYHLRITEDTKVQEIYINPENMTVEEIIWWDADQSTGRLLYNDYRVCDEEGRLFPYEISYQTMQGVSLRIRYGDITFNPDSSAIDRLINVVLPDHVVVMPLEPDTPAIFPFDEQE